MPVHERAAVDSLALEMFQARCVDADATKARLEAQLDDINAIATHVLDQIGTSSA